MTAKELPEIKVTTSDGYFEVLKALGPGGIANLDVTVVGEAGYTISVGYSDGRTLNEEHYVESGYAITHLVHPDRIESDVNLSP